MPHTQRQQVGSRGQCTPLLLLLLLPILSLAPQPCQAAIHIPSNYNISDLKEPPVITTHPVSVTLFHLEDVGLSCEATGNPPPSFRWTKDGEEFDPSLDPELKVFEGTGSFASDLGASGIGTGPLKKYQGKYICYASNDLGTAISNEVILNTDSPPQLPKNEKNVKKKADEGESMVLKCNPPPSSMEPIIHWMDWKLRHIQLTDRVMLGKDGNLYFAHLTIADSRNDYTCNIQYLLTRQVLPKQPISLSVTASNSAVRNRRPQMMRPTGLHSTYSALRGQSLELECIVQGLPTPTVTWLRKDDQMSESRITREMHDRRLAFSNISESDGGEYQCTAINTQGKVTHTYTVIVEAAPYWTKKPESELYAPYENVKLDCQADGTPSPTISWSMNGAPLSEIDKDPRRSVTSAGALILRDVEFSDTAIYQCKASNKHGTILANTNVYVIELEPQILSKDGQTKTVVEGQEAVLNCQTFGSPKPKVTWTWQSDSDPSTLLEDPRVNPLANGALQITNVSHDDSGLYTCSVLHSNLSISAVLEVLNRTVIISPPQSLNVLPGEAAIFTCLAVVDPKLPAPLIQWRKNLQKIFQSHDDDKYTMKGPDLIVTNVEPEDEGIYTCDVITELDTVSASGSITLVDRPDPPGLLQIADHKHRAVTLSWTPGDDHNSPVIEYVVEFEDQGTKHSGWEELKRVGGNKATTNLPLLPYMSYRFRVIAVNDVGQSDPSRPSDIHNTPAEAPDNNPEDVRSESVDPDSLVITWEDMDKRSFNGPDFQYRVLWRRVMGSGPTWHVNYTTTPPFVVNDVGNYSAFEIKVQAINEKGEGPEPDPVIGYSGEDVPLEAPMDPGVAVLNSTAIRVTWAPVDKDTVRGLLLGYKIHLTRFGSRGHHRGRRSREPESTAVIETGPNEEKRVIGGLKPYSHYRLSVTVYNSKGEGPHSEPLAFHTEEGAPGPPMSLVLDSPGEQEITVRWSPPAEPNGILKGYLLQFMVVDSDDNTMQVVNIDDPETTHWTLTGLDPHSRYRFYLSGHTDAGDGKTIMREGATVLEGAPPDNFGLSIGEKSVNFSWVTNERHRNLVFQIHYLKKNGNDKWKLSESVTVNSSQSFYELKGLSPGSNYHLSFTHSSNKFWETDITTSGTGVMESTSFATEGWFIGLVSAIVLLLLILLILCFIKRSKGGKYSVKDKEEGPMDSEARPMKDETFGEYRSLESDNEEKNTASQASLCDGSKLCSEDTLEFLGSSAITTELNIDVSLDSQYSRPSEAAELQGLPDSSPLNPSTVPPPTNNGLPNSVAILD